MALLGLLVGGGFGAWALGLAAAVMPVGLMLLGAARRGRVDRGTAAVLAATAVALLASFVALLVLAGGPRAVPASLLVLFAGVWLLPLLVVGVGYAVTFRHHGVTDDDLARLAALGAAAPKTSLPTSSDRETGR